jgi:hypothetical protein
VGVFALALVIHTLWEADGFFLHLATEIVGILITICYVDWILREHEQEKWRATDTRIANRLRILLNVIVSSIRHGLGYGPEILNERVMASLDLITTHKEVIRVGEHVIAPSVHHRIRSLDADGWKSLARQIEHAYNGTLVFLSTFQSRLSPEQISHLLDIQESLSNSLVSYTTFPELMGVPEDQLPETKTPPKDLQQYSCESTANEIHKVLAIAKKLSETLDEDDA